MASEGSDRSHSHSGSNNKEMAMYENVTWHNRKGSLLLTRTHIIFKTTKEDDQNENEGSRLQLPEKSIRWSWHSIKKMQVNKRNLMIKLWSFTQKGKSVTFALERDTELNKLRLDVNGRLRLSRPTACKEKEAAASARARTQQDTNSCATPKGEAMDQEVEENNRSSVVLNDTFKGSMTATSTTDVNSCLCRTRPLPKEGETKKTPTVSEHLDSDSDTCSTSSADEEASLGDINGSSRVFTNEVRVVPSASSSSAITLKRSQTSTNLLGKKLRQLLVYLLPNLSFFISP